MRIGRSDPLGGGLNGIKIELVHKFEDIISIENLLSAWQEFVRGKRNKSDVRIFSRNLFDNIFQTHEELKNKTYRHGGYKHFNISDPKPRNISKASVRDRLVHHAVFRILYPFFDKIFISDSYSCRNNKGTHKAVRRLHQMFLDASDYNRKTCWVLKLDIKKFFASIDHKILMDILKKYIFDQNILWLLQEIISSFQDKHYHTTEYSSICWKGLPLGNLTSQLFANVYMNEFDQFMKHQLKVKHYIRYADDFAILSHDKKYLTLILERIKVFLREELKLELHPNKIILKTYASGIDFLGWVNFPTHRVLRAGTRRRSVRRVNSKNINSYLGLIKHGNTYKIKQELLNNIWLNETG